MSRKKPKLHTTGDVIFCCLGSIVGFIITVGLVSAVISEFDKYVRSVAVEAAQISAETVSHRYAVESVNEANNFASQMIETHESRFHQKDVAANEKAMLKHLTFTDNRIWVDTENKIISRR